MHPQSDRANYQLARIYMKLMQNEQNSQQKRHYAQLAQHALNKAKNSYIPANGAWFAELHLASYLGNPVSQQTINELIWRLEYKPFQNSNVSFLSAFSNCQIDGFCKVPHEQAVLIIAAGLNNQGVDNILKSEIYKLLTQYFVGVISDLEKGEEFIREALSLNNDVNGRLLFSQIYRLQGKLIMAQQQVDIAKQLDKKNLWFKEIAIEDGMIVQATSSGK